MSTAAELVEFVVRRLVHHQDDVVLEVLEEDGASRLRLRVNSEDMGRIIGRSGRTAKALRTLVGTATGGSESPTLLEIAD
ncbi:MAG: KH domain-containing protein [Candidatus Hydrogenedens sp.]|nr:KH domain-containing protein [Candidatus Hydrogenedentota bacterium]NLF58007.1 KH domain-containing protein [Candidatus Hydrogenedens sp.]